MRRSRRWYSGIVIAAKTALTMFEALRRHRLGVFIPFVAFLLLGSAVIWLVNTIAPLAPFVYSLF